MKGGQYSQRQMIKQQLHNQNLRLREAFVREDVRLTGTIAGNMPQVAATLRAGGLELSKAQVQQARKTFVTGDGRFNWELFCDAIEKARTDANKESALMKHARMFKQIDQDDSGRISRDELETALHASNVSMPQDQIDKVLNTIDADGDGNISYPEFVDGMAKEMMTGANVFSRVATANSMRSPRRQ